MNQPFKSKVIFITGCSTGIGLDAAQKLTIRGHRVIASCRKEVDVERITALGLETILMDVSDSTSIRRGFDLLLQKTEGKLDVLINNAGYEQVGALEDLSSSLLRRQFETNVFGLMELTRLAIPIMRHQGQGRIINISSILGFISMPFRGAYNASKYAVEGLSDTLRLELKTANIDVICIQPGPIESQFRENARNHSLKEIDTEHSAFKQHYEAMLEEYEKEKTANPPFTKPATAVTQKLIHAIESEKPHAKYPVTLPAYGFMILKRFLPTKALDAIIRFMFRKQV